MNSPAGFSDSFKVCQQNLKFPLPDLPGLYSSHMTSFTEEIHSWHNGIVYYRTVFSMTVELEIEC